MLIISRFISKSASKIVGWDYTRWSSYTYRRLDEVGVSTGGQEVDVFPVNLPQHQLLSLLRLTSSTQPVYTQSCCSLHPSTLTELSFAFFSKSAVWNSWPPALYDHTVCHSTLSNYTRL